MARDCNPYRGPTLNKIFQDVGGTSVKILLSGQQNVRTFPSGPELTAQQMVAGVLKATKGSKYDVVSIGYLGPVIRGALLTEPKNLGPGWVGFDFRQVFGCPVTLINDAAMQALGGYEGGRILFLGLGTGLGSALVADKVIMPMELAHLPCKKGGTFEDYVGRRGLERLGKKKWRRTVEDVVLRRKTALVADDVLLGGGNAKKLKRLPEGVRLGGNAHAFIGGQRLWEEAEVSSE